MPGQKLRLVQNSAPGLSYSSIFHGYKNDNFPMKKYNIFLILAKTLIVGTH